MQDNYWDWYPNQLGDYKRQIKAVRGGLQGRNLLDSCSGFFNRTDRHHSCHPTNRIKWPKFGT